MYKQRNGGTTKKKCHWKTHKMRCKSGQATTTTHTGGTFKQSVIQCQWESGKSRTARASQKHQNQNVPSHAICITSGVDSLLGIFTLLVFGILVIDGGGAQAKPIEHKAGGKNAVRNEGIYILF